MVKKYWDKNKENSITPDNILRFHKQIPICSSAISEYSLIDHTEINFKSILSITYVKDTPNLHTHTHYSHSFGLIWGCKVL